MKRHLHGGEKTIDVKKKNRAHHVRTYPTIPYIPALHSLQILPGSAV
jgi:hypothetical protein